MVNCNREMTLDEWVDELPEYHSAHKEYEELKRLNDAKDERIVELKKALLDATEIDDAICRRLKNEYRAIANK